MFIWSNITEREREREGEREGERERERGRERERETGEPWRPKLLCLINEIWFHSCIKSCSHIKKNTDMLLKTLFALYAEQDEMLMLKGLNFRAER